MRDRRGERERQCTHSYGVAAAGMHRCERADFKGQERGVVSVVRRVVVAAGVVVSRYL